VPGGGKKGGWEEKIPAKLWNLCTIARTAEELRGAVERNLSTQRGRGEGQKKGVPLLISKPPSRLFPAVGANPFYMLEKATISSDQLVRGKGGGKKKGKGRDESRLDLRSPIHSPFTMEKRSLGIGDFER